MRRLNEGGNISPHDNILITLWYPLAHAQAQFFRKPSIFGNLLYIIQQWNVDFHFVKDFQKHPTFFICLKLNPMILYDYHCINYF